MKTLFLTLVFITLFVFGCVEQQSQVTSPQESTINKSISFLKLPSDLKSGGLSTETSWSTSQYITGNTGGDIHLNIFQSRPGNSLGDFEVHATISVAPNSFEANQQWLFIVSLDDENALLNITPPPTSLNHQLLIDFYVRGVDVTGVTPETLGFCYISDNEDVIQTESTTYTINPFNHSITIVNAVIPGGITPLPGSRYGWVRKAE
jgi:hypothetical protein